MTVSAAFLDEASSRLTALGNALTENASTASSASTSIGGDLDGLATHWSGPRADSVIGQARSYMSVVAPFPDAVESAAGTVTSWASTASDLAVQLAAAEQTLLRSIMDPIGTILDPEARQEQSEALSAIGEINAVWQVSCTTYAAVLTAAISAINVCKDAVAIPPASSFVLSSMPTSGGPDAISDWWAGLSSADQVAVAAAMPGALGSLEGIPAGVRDLVNRILLVSNLATLQAAAAAGTISQVQRRVLENVRNVISVLAAHEDHLDPITGQPTIALLYIYEPAAFGGDGRVAIAIGNLDTARHIAVTVPGMFSNVTGMSPGTAQNIYDEARWASGESVAVLDWMGYDSPDFNPTSTGINPETAGDFLGQVGDLSGVLDRNKAHAGAALLAADVAGINAMRGGYDPHLTVIGNSYGSTTAAIAADERGLEADDLILTGSPGAGAADHASDFTTGTEHTWVGGASRDLVTYLGESGGWDPADTLSDLAPGVENMGHDPSEDAFGANRFQAESVDRRGGDDDRQLTDINITDHGRYYNEDSESLYNVGAIVGGEHDLVVEADPRDKQPFVETHNPVEEFDVDVDVDAGASVDVPMCDIPGPIPGSVPCGLPDVDAHLDVDVDADIDVRSPIDVNLVPDDPEGSRTPEEMTHAP